MKKLAAELEGHITKDEGNVTDLDPFAVNLLKPKRETCKALNERNYYLFKAIPHKPLKIRKKNGII